MRYWSEKSSHKMQQYYSQRPQKLNELTGIVRNTIIGPEYLMKLCQEHFLLKNYLINISKFRQRLLFYR